MPSDIRFEAVTASQQDIPSFVLFDVDGTLTRRDTLLPFLRRVAGAGAVCAALGRAAAAVLTGAAASRNEIKEILTATLAGRAEVEIREAGKDHAQWIFSHCLRSSVLERLQHHRIQGSRIVLVSASLRPYLEPLGELLGAQDVICTDLEVRDSTLTGRLSGPNCRGEEKVTQVVENLGHIWPRTVVYGNGKGDKAMLEAAALGYRVGKMGTVRDVTTRLSSGHAKETR
jgi:phosphatidylglycerophosphatase C